MHFLIYWHHTSLICIWFPLDMPVLTLDLIKRRSLYRVRPKDGPHRKWKETKQQPSTLSGPAVPGCCLVSFHFLCGPFCGRTRYTLPCCGSGWIEIYVGTCKFKEPFQNVFIVTDCIWGSFWIKCGLVVRSAVLSTEIWPYRRVIDLCLMQIESYQKLTP